MPNERLDKIISNSSKISRSELKKLAKRGAVKLNGQTVTDLSVKVDCENCEIELDGQLLDTRKFIYIMLNKPKGTVSASTSSSDITVVDILPENLKWNGLFPAGRLDKDTTGFVLITNDGGFAHRILSPSNHVPKTYIAQIDKPCTDEKKSILESGITLKDGTVFKPALVKILNDEKTLVEIVICEGKYHQIKRMFKAVGSDVIELKRIKIGSLTLDESLTEGEAREIRADELKMIK